MTCPMTDAVVAFVGRSGSGKTTLLTQVIPALAALGVRAAVVKHAPDHAVVTDCPGSDTHRFWAAGAQHVALAARDRVVHTHRYAADPGLSATLSGVHDVDLILLEGYKRSGVPKVEVIRGACNPQPLSGLVGRIACVTDVTDMVLEVPCFGFDAVAPLAAFLMAQVVRH